MVWDDLGDLVVFLIEMSYEKNATLYVFNWRRKRRGRVKRRKESIKKVMSYVIGHFPISEPRRQSKMRGRGSIGVVLSHSVSHSPNTEGR